MTIKSLYFFITTSLITISLLFLTACKKEQVLNADKGKVVNLDIKGYVMADTLEFVLNNTVIGQAIDANFKFDTKLINSNDRIDIRKKSDKKLVGSIAPATGTFNQVKKIFYDGQKVAENLELTPVSNPQNMGVRFRFSTNFKDFYGGPVDIELLDLDYNDFSMKPVKIISGVTASFGDFIELPDLGANHSYVLSVYKAGTKEMPYKTLDNVDLGGMEPEFYNGYFNFTAGESVLLSVSPYGDKDKIGGGYEVIDFSSAFR